MGKEQVGRKDGNHLFYIRLDARKKPHRSMLARVSLHPTPFSQQGRKKLHWQVTNIRKRGFAASDPGCVRCARSGSQVGLCMKFFFFWSQKHTHICSHTILSRKTNHEKPRGWGRTDSILRKKESAIDRGLGRSSMMGNFLEARWRRSATIFYCVCGNGGGGRNEGRRCRTRKAKN